MKLFSFRSANCPFGDMLEEDDDNCFSTNKDSEYEVISENHPDFAGWLADIRGVGFADVTSRPVPFFDLPPFMPTIRHGSKGLLKSFNPEYIAVSLGDVISHKKLITAKDIRQRFGVDKYTKIVLLNYAEDALIERIWTIRKDIFSQLAKLDFDLVTSINYSIWFSQPHAERLINMKRSLITFEELQKLGIPTLPHIYWTGKTDLKRWANWLNSNAEVWCVAVNLQTERDSRSGRWDQALSDLRYLVSLLDRDIHFFISGASTLERCLQLKEAFPKLTITNGFCARQAACGFLLSEELGKLKFEHSNTIPKNDILKINTNFYTELMNSEKASSIPFASYK